MKGTAQKVLREIATLAEGAVKVLGERFRTKKVRKIQVAKDRLRREVDFLRGELKSIKRHSRTQTETTMMKGGNEKNPQARQNPLR